MFAKLRTAVIVSGILGAFVIGGCAAAGFIKCSGSPGTSRPCDRGDGCGKAQAAVHTVPASEETCHEN